jgi:hypothetical protein
MEQEYSNVFALLNDLQLKRQLIVQKFEKSLADLDREIEAVNTTLRLLRKSGATLPQDTECSESNEQSDFPVEQLQGKTQLEALAFLASANTDHLVSVKAAKALLIKAGLLKDSKNALAMLYTVIARSGKFEKAEPGKYRLIDSSAPLLLVSHVA